MNESKPASGCTGPSDCSQVPAIESAVLNIGTATSDCGLARDAWIDANWDDAVMWINCAIAQLESARAKIQSHVANIVLSINDFREDREGKYLLQQVCF